MHTGLVSGWAGSMSLYEVVIFDSSDPVYDPVWRQGCYLLPFISRIGVVSSSFGWNLGASSLEGSPFWTFETVVATHILLSGLLILSAFWHWSYWDLALFVSRTGTLRLDLLKVFSIHLLLAAILCFGFGYGHLSGLAGPGAWTSDSKGLVGAVRSIKPIYTILGCNPYCSGSVVAHHIASGVVGILVSLWHLTSRPGPLLYQLVRMSSLESVLSSSLAAVFVSSYLTSATMWYSSVTTPIELLGPSRYHWDNGLFSQDILTRVALVDSSMASESWSQVPDKLILYDYIGCNPAKGGLFRAGPLIKGDGLVQNWLGHPTFEYGNLALSVRRMPAFFETFPVVLIDKGGTIRADIPFRRGSSVNSIEQNPIFLHFDGGVLASVEYSSAPIVKSYARKALFGEIFTFDVSTSSPDGVWRTSSRGWYSFAHVLLAFLFFFGHLWHGLRALYREVWCGVAASASGLEYGSSETLKG
jgi:photosystem II CP47 chlorophyll apoprotein